MDKKLIDYIFNGYQSVDRLPEDPEGSLLFGSATSNTIAICQVWEIDESKAMDLDSQALVNGIHNSLDPNQALIEVGCDKSLSGHDYIYSIVKTLKEPNGVQYFVLCHYWSDDSVLNFQGFFDEVGTTGTRDSMIYSSLLQQHSYEEIQNKWWFDPYDNNFKHQTLMNLSEKKELDEYFPEHPLSLARAFIEKIKQS